MSSLKKLFRKYRFPLLFLVVVGLTVTLLLVRGPKLIIGYIPTHYSISSEADTWQVNVYSNQRNSFYFNVGSVTNCYLKSNVETSFYKVHLIGVEKKDSIKLESGRFYEYSLELDLPVRSNHLESIPDCYLELEYGDDSLRVYLGEFSLVGQVDTLDIRIDLLKGTVEKKNLLNLSGLIVTLTNLEKYSIELTKGVAVSSVCFINDIYLITDSSIDNDTPVSSVIETGEKITRLSLASGETVSLFLPIEKRSDILLDQLGVILYFEEGCKIIPSRVLFRGLSDIKDSDLVFQAYDFY